MQERAGPSGGIDMSLSPLIFFNYGAYYLMYAFGILLLSGVVGLFISPALAEGESRATGIGVCNCAVLILNDILCCAMMRALAMIERVCASVAMRSCLQRFLEDRVPCSPVRAGLFRSRSGHSR